MVINRVVAKQQQPLDAGQIRQVQLLHRDLALRRRGMAACEKNVKTKGWVARRRGAVPAAALQHTCGASECCHYTARLVALRQRSGPVQAGAAAVGSRLAAAGWETLAPNAASARDSTGQARQLLFSKYCCTHTPQPKDHLLNQALTLTPGCKSAATRCPASAERLHSVTSAPACARARTVSTPMPELPPGGEGGAARVIEKGQQRSSSGESGRAAALAAAH